MDFQLLFFFLFCAGYTLVIIFCEYLHRKRNVHPEYTRKLAHMLSCLSSLLFLPLFSSHWYVLLLGVASFSILFYGQRKQAFHSIDSVDRKTYGSFLLPVAICSTYYFAVLYENTVLFILPVLILSISDPLAGIAGKRYGWKKITSQKTITGTFTFFLSAFIICYVILFFLSKTGNILCISLGISSVACITELITPRGIDNVSIPFSIILSLFIFGQI